MRRSAGFDPDSAWRQLLEEQQDPRSRQASLHHNRAFSIDRLSRQSKADIDQIDGRSNSGADFKPP